MTDFKELLKKGCMVETHINYINHLTENESKVLSILTTHPANYEFDTFDFTSNYEINLETLVGLTELSKKGLIQALEGLEEKGHIKGGGDSEEIVIYLKPYNRNLKN